MKNPTTGGSRDSSFGLPFLALREQLHPRRSPRVRLVDDRDAYFRFSSTRDASSPLSLFKVMSPSSASTSKSAAAASSSARVESNVHCASRHPLSHASSTIRNNLFVGSADDDVMSNARYIPLETRESGSGFSGDSAENQLHRRHRHRQSTTSSIFPSGSASDDGFADEQFLLHASSTSSPKIPRKAICLALFLFCLGTIMCVIGGLLLSGIYIDQKYNDRTWPVLCLGLIMFIPGSYHVRIAYYAWKNVPGYHYADIPDWD